MKNRNLAAAMLTFFAVLGIQSASFGQATWTSNGNDLYTTTSGNVGIGTASPIEKLDVAGVVKASSFRGSGSSITSLNVNNVSSGVLVEARMSNGSYMINSAGTDGQVWTSTGSGRGQWETISTGDNLGNHGVTQNIQMNNNWISGDGNSEGLFVSYEGRVGVGTSNLNDALTVAGTIYSTSGGIKFPDGTVQSTAATGGGTSYQAGTGIGISGTTISNTGDTDASDDITTSTVAGGDLSGTFSNLSVNKLRGQNLSTTAPFHGQVLEWDSFISEWVPTTLNTGDNLGNHGATVNIQMNNNWISGDGNSEGLFVSYEGRVGVGTSNPGSQLTVSGTIESTSGGIKFPDGTVQTTAATGGGTSYQAGTGIGISGTTISNTGDTDASDDITTSSTAGGDLSGSFSNLSVNKLQGRSMSATAPATNQVLGWNGTTWTPMNMSGGDNLGNHGVTQNIQMNNNWISGDGNSEGLFVSYEGRVGVGTSNLSDAFTVAGTIYSTSGGIKFPDGTVQSTAATGGGGTSYQAGTGIGISGTTISNTGDTDASDDITTSTVAGGDLSGTFSNLSVNKIKGQNLSATAPVHGQVLEWNSFLSEWAPTTLNTGDNMGNHIATVNVRMNNNWISGDGNSEGLFVKNDGKVGVGTNNPMVEFDVAGGIRIANSTGTTAGIIRWTGADFEGYDGSAWKSLTSGGTGGTTYQAGTGISISGTTITNTGDTNPSDDITTSSTAGGDLSGTFSNLSVNKIKGRDLSATAPQDGQVLQWNDPSSQWVPATLSGGAAYQAGAGISISGSTIINTGDTDASDDITTSSTAGGDLSGTFSNLSVNKIKGRDLSAAAPATNQVLGWNGTAWAPMNMSGGSADNMGNHTATQNISLSGHWISNDGSNEGIRIDANGNVGIGTAAPQYPLDIVGTVRTCEVKVSNLQGWCDYVFEEDYELPALEEVEAYIKTNKHLMDIPSEAHVMEHGISLGEMDAALLKKVEELTLYVIELKKENQSLKEEKNTEMKALLERIEKLESK